MNLPKYPVAATFLAMLSNSPATFGQTAPAPLPPTGRTLLATPLAPPPVVAPLVVAPGGRTLLPTPLAPPPVTVSPASSRESASDIDFENDENRDE